MKGWVIVYTLLALGVATSSAEETLLLPGGARAESPGQKKAQDTAPSSEPASFSVSSTQLKLRNPTSGARLWAKVLHPADASREKRYPAIVLIPGGLGCGSDMERTPEPSYYASRGFVVGLFDPDGRGKSKGKKDHNGKIQQDGLHQFLKEIAKLEYVQRNNIGVVSQSYGIVLACGMLARYPDDPPVKYLIDIEGPSRFVRYNDPFLRKDFGTHPAEWWREREAIRWIDKITCMYLRIQKEKDHAYGQYKGHALEMMKAATHTRYGGKGSSPWTCINSPQDNKPNRAYSPGDNPRWFPTVANRLGPEYISKFIRMMAEMEI